MRRHSRDGYHQKGSPFGIRGALCGPHGILGRETLYRSAAYSAKKYVWQATDDAMLVEKIGHRVMMVDCGSENRKITYPVDLKLAEQILLHRAAEKEDTQ